MSTRPTAEEIRQARSRVALWMHPSRIHLLGEQCAPAIATLLAATDPAFNGPGTESVCGQHVCRNCGETVNHSWEDCATELRRELEAAVQE